MAVWSDPEEEPVHVQKVGITSKQQSKKENLSKNIFWIGSLFLCFVILEQPCGLTFIVSLKSSKNASRSFSVGAVKDNVR